MLGVEKSHCNAAILALCTASEALAKSRISEVLRTIPTYGKGDTLGMDAMPEIIIVETLRDYDDHSVVITEEIGSREDERFADSEDPGRFRTVFICDPTDRSAQIKKALEAVEDKNQTVENAMSSPEFKSAWEKNFSKPVSITGGSSAITCVRRGIPIFSVIINYVTKQLFLACSAGCYMVKITNNPKEIDVDYVTKNGKIVYFNNTLMNSNKDKQRFTTFLGKTGYRENFLGSGLMTEEDMLANLHYDLPGGPSRALYLSTLQPQKLPLGFILSNGEKITEWIHWIPYLRFGRTKEDQGKPALKLYEVSQDRPWTNKGILMSTPPFYSIFKPVNKYNQMVIDVGRFGNFENPSHIRSTLILAPASNQWANHIVNQYGYREIKIAGE